MCRPQRIRIEIQFQLASQHDLRNAADDAIRIFSPREINRVGHATCKQIRYAYN